MAESCQPSPRARSSRRKVQNAMPWVGRSRSPETTRSLPGRPSRRRERSAWRRWRSPSRPRARPPRDVALAAASRPRDLVAHALLGDRGQLLAEVGKHLRRRHGAELVDVLAAIALAGSPPSSFSNRSRSGWPIVMVDADGAALPLEATGRSSVIAPSRPSAPVRRRLGDGRLLRLLMKPTTRKTTAAMRANCSARSRARWRARRSRRCWRRRPRSGRP